MWETRIPKTPIHSVLHPKRDMKKSEAYTRFVSMRPDSVETEEWLQTIREEEAKVLSRLHQELIQRMVDKASANITSTLEMPDPETEEQDRIVEDEGTYRIQFTDGSALVIGSEVNGFYITLGIHSSRVPDDDEFQGFRFIEEENGLNGQHLPMASFN